MGKKKAEVCPSPIGNMIAALEARILHSPGGTSPGKPISPGLVTRVNKVLADGGEDLGEFDAGDFQSLSWLLRMEIFERVGCVTGTLRHLTVSCKALYESVVRGVAQGVLQIGGRREQLWRCLKSMEEGGNVWEDWVQHGKSDLSHLVSTAAYLRSRTAFELLVGCCIHADRPDFMYELIQRGSPFWDTALCSTCTSAREWCRCPASTRGVGITPLGLCCIHNHSKTASVLLEAGASLTFATTLPSAPMRPLQPIHLCCTHGSARTAGIICSFQPRTGAMATQSDMSTPLMLAVQQNDRNTSEVLLAHPYHSVTARDINGQTVSDMLTDKHSDSFVELLFEAGAEPNKLINQRLDAKEKAKKARFLQQRALARMDSVDSLESMTPRGGLSSRDMLSNGLLTARSSLSTPRSGQLTARLLLPPVVRSMSNSSLCSDGLSDPFASTKTDIKTDMDSRLAAMLVTVSNENTEDCSSSRSNASSSWESEGQSSSDEPISRADMKAASLGVVTRGVAVPKLDFGASGELKTPRSAQRSCGLPSSIKLMQGNQRSVQAFNRALQRSARLRATMEDSESEESSAGSAATSPIDGMGSDRSMGSAHSSNSSGMVSDCDRTPDDRACVPIPSLDLSKMGMKLGGAMAPVQNNMLSARSQSNLQSVNVINTRKEVSKTASKTASVEDFDDLLGELDMAF